MNSYMNCQAPSLGLRFLAGGPFFGPRTQSLSRLAGRMRLNLRGMTSVWWASKLALPCLAWS